MVARIIICSIMNILLIAWLIVYAIKYHLGQNLIAYILKNRGLIDRTHRLQMRRKAERKPLKGFLSTLNDLLKNAGFRSMFPGNSPILEAGISLYLIIDLIIIGGFFKFPLMTRLLAGAFIFILIPVIGQNICRRRTYEAEEQLSALGKMASNASIQYRSIEEIFSNHYGEFTGSLAYACEEYYINMLVNKDKERSIKRFKDTFCSPMIDIMIENFTVSEEDEDRDLSMAGILCAEAAEEYVSATKGNRSLLNQARVRVSISLIAIIAVFLLGGFFAEGMLFSGLFSFLKYEGYPVDFLPDWLTGGCGIYILIVSIACYLWGIYQKKGF